MAVSVLSSIRLEDRQERIWRARFNWPLSACRRMTRILLWTFDLAEALRRRGEV